MERFRQPQHYRSPDAAVQEVKQIPTEFVMNILICPLCGEPIPGNRDTASHKCGEVSTYLREALGGWHVEGEYERRVAEVGGKGVVEKMGQFKAFLAAEAQKRREAAPVGVSGSGKISFMTIEEMEALVKAKELPTTENPEEKSKSEAAVLKEREKAIEPPAWDPASYRKKKPIIE